MQKINQISLSSNGLVSFINSNPIESKNSLLGGVIQGVRSNFTFTAPQIQKNLTLEKNQTDLTVTNKIRNFVSDSISNFIFSPSDYMVLNHKEESLEHSEYYLSEIENQPNSWVNLFSPLTAWNLLLSLNPYFISSRNVNVSERQEQIAEENASSVGHIISVICNNVSSRSILPQEIHFILNLTSFYLTNVSNTKLVVDTLLYLVNKSEEKTDLSSAAQVKVSAEELNHRLQERLNDAMILLRTKIVQRRENISQGNVIQFTNAVEAKEKISNLEQKAKSILNETQENANSGIGITPYRYMVITYVINLLDNLSKIRTSISAIPLNELTIKLLIIEEELFVIMKEINYIPKRLQNAE